MKRSCSILKLKRSKLNTVGTMASGGYLIEHSVFGENGYAGIATVDTAPYCRWLRPWRVVERSPIGLAVLHDLQHWDGATPQVARFAPCRAGRSNVARWKLLIPSLARHLPDTGTTQTL